MRLAILSSHTHTRRVAVLLGHTQCILKCDSVHINRLNLRSVNDAIYTVAGLLGLPRHIYRER